MSIPRLLNSLHPLIVPFGNLPFSIHRPVKHPVQVDLTQHSNPCKPELEKVYCGGLAALCQAVHTLFENTKTQVIYCCPQDALLPSTLQLSTDPTTFIPKTIFPLSATHQDTLHALADRLRTSISFHKQLNKTIQESIGTPTFVSSGRVLYATNTTQFAAHWNRASTFDIPTDPFDESDLRQQTLLKEDAGIVPLHKQDGGYLLPEVSLNIIEFLNQTFPNRFTHLSNPIETLTNRAFLAAAAHLRATQPDSQPLWVDQPIPEITSCWKGIIPRAEFEERHISFEHLLPVENDEGLFFTPLCFRRSQHEVHLIMQISRICTEIDDENRFPLYFTILRELNARFIGKWELMTSRTLWHDTTPPNALPESLSSQWLNLSALENSLSGARLEEST